MTDTIPTINVNLHPCACGCPVFPNTHVKGCAGIPVHVPLSLEPWRTVTMKVRLGECICPPGHFEIMRNYDGHAHQDCPARPVEVTCFISGSTWEETQVGEEIECAPSVSALVEERIWAACRDRWALVKALVTGESPADPFGRPVVVPPLFLQRDAMYAALCEMARLEQALAQSVKSAASTLGSSSFPPPIAVQYAESGLFSYIQELAKQVGALP